MQVTDWPYAALILPDSAALDPAPYMQAAADVLDRLDHDPERAPRQNRRKQTVFAHSLALRVTVDEQSAYGPRVALQLITRDGSPADEEAAAKVLSDTVEICLGFSNADVIEWFSPDMLVEADDFLRLRRYVSPRRELDGLDDAESSLSREFRDALSAEAEDGPSRPTDRLEQFRVRIEESEPAELRMGAASWILTGVLAFVAFPVAVALWIIGLLRGMDFRLASQALAVTALFLALGEAGELNQLILRWIY